GEAGPAGEVMGPGGQRCERPDVRGRKHVRRVREEVAEPLVVGVQGDGLAAGLPAEPNDLPLPVPDRVVACRPSQLSLASGCYCRTLGHVLASFGPGSSPAW